MVAMVLVGCGNTTNASVSPNPIIKSLTIVIDEPKVDEGEVGHTYVRAGERFLVRAHISSCDYTVGEESTSEQRADMAKIEYTMYAYLYDSKGKRVSEDSFQTPIWQEKPSMFLLRAVEHGEHRLEIVVECHEPNGAKTHWTRSIVVRV